MKKGLLVLALLFLTASTELFAQSNARFEGGLAFAVGSPVGEFGDQVEDPGFGLNLFGAAGLADAPVLVGLDFGFLIYGRETRTEPFSTTIPDVTVEVLTENNIVNGHLFLRLQPASGSFRPYADGLVGFKYLFTDTRIRNEGFDDEDIARSTNFDDTALSYGFGGGIQMQLWSPRKRTEGPSAVSLNLGARYLIGTNAEYLKEGSIRREGTRVQFDIIESETSLLLFHLGVSMRF